MRAKGDGRSESLIRGNWHFHNGLAISPKDRSIFMIESTAADILRVLVNKDGTVGSPEIYARLQGNIPDELAFSKNDKLYVSCYNPNRTYVISPK